MDADYTTYHSELNATYFNDKIIWITGASSGIGKALAHFIASLETHNTKLVLSARREAALKEIKNIILQTHNHFKDNDILVLPLDLNNSDANYYTKQYESILKHFDTTNINILINNAGFTMRSSYADFNLSDTLSMLQVNLVSPMILSKLVLDDLKQVNQSPNIQAPSATTPTRNKTPMEKTKAKDEIDATRERGICKAGHIVNVSSVAGRLWPAMRTSYTVTKVGLIGFGYALSHELTVKEEMENVFITSILPGPVATDIDTLAKGKGGTIHGKKDAMIANGMAPLRCAELMCVAISNPDKIKESWVSTQPILNGMYHSYYMPDRFERIMRPKISSWLKKASGY